MSLLTSFYFQTIYEVIVDGKIGKRVVNTNPLSYKNVKVWAATGKVYPIANARIQNLLFKQNGKSDYLCC